MVKLRSFFLIFFLSTMVALGCGGPGRHGASGSVSYKGKPIKAGIISFIPEGARNSAGGAPIIDGKYDVPANPGLPAGKYKVTVSMQEGGAPPMGDAPGESNPQPKELIPEKYNTKTELTAEVKAGSPNTFNFDLK